MQIGDEGALRTTLTSEVVASSSPAAALQETRVSGRPAEGSSEDEEATRSDGGLAETRVSASSAAQALGPEGSLAEARLGRGAVISRYVVLDRLGAGAMGEVSLAIDTELHRKVALKLLKRGEHEHPSATWGEEARARLLREAQALARLSHPNVVAIYDVGTWQSEVWIAMEFVEGVTLRRWLEAKRSWVEVVAMMTQVARGLAAAHAAGLVHRDVKPDNVMVDLEGRARVMDFGLARREPQVQAAAAAAGGDSGLLSIEVTTAGQIVGTPAYMAPEQLLGAAAGASADLFALCVTWWEAIYGARPFAGATLVELRRHVVSGALLPPRRGSGAPRWLAKVLARGLAVEPAQRWPSVAALLAELERQQRRSRGLRRLGLVGALAGLGLAGWATQAWAYQRQLAGCEAEGQAIAGVIDEAAMGQIERAFVATGKPAAAVIFAKTRPWLERWARAWQAAATEVCLAGSVERRWDAPTQARARDCLEETRGSFEALVQELRGADEITLVKATTAAAAVAAPADCLDPTRLRERPLTPPEQVAQVRALRASLAKVRSLRWSGHFTAAREAAAAALAAARASTSPWMIASAELEMGVSEKEAGEYVAAEASLLRALAAAREARAPRVALVSMMQLVWVVGDRGARFAEGKAWAEGARTLLTMQLGSRRLDEAELDNNLAQVLLSQRMYAEALALQERALAGWSAELGEEHPTVGQALNNLGAVRAGMGHYAEAIRLHERALAIREAALGAMHPLVAGSLSNLGIARSGSGDLEGRVALDRRALAIREALLPADHPAVVESLNNLAGAYLNLKKPAEAEPLYLRALAIVEGAPPERQQPRMIATLMYNIALIRAETGDSAGAAAMFRRSREVFEAALGPEHLDLTYPMNGLMGVLMDQGDDAAALPLAEKVLAMRSATLGERHPEVADALLGLARLRVRMGAGVEAVALAERAIAVLKGSEGVVDPRFKEPLCELAEALSAAKWPAEAVAVQARAQRLSAALAAMGVGCAP